MKQRRINDLAYDKNEAIDHLRKHVGMPLEHAFKAVKHGHAVVEEWEDPRCGLTYTRMPLEKLVDLKNSIVHDVLHWLKHSGFFSLTTKFGFPYGIPCFVG